MRPSPKVGGPLPGGGLTPPGPGPAVLGAVRSGSLEHERRGGARLWDRLLVLGSVLAAVLLVACFRSSAPEPPLPPGGEPAAPPPIEENSLQGVAPTAPDETPSAERFEAALSPYGRWVDTPEYGRVWVPQVAPGWRPYTNGEWAYTDHGWGFVSYDPWGWAPFHYGRWVWLPGYGWVWIPGYQWAPAWVSWRYGPSYVAWAPLAPGGVSVGYYRTPSLWTAVRGRDFYRRLTPRIFIPTARINVVLRNTHFGGIPRGRIYYSPPARYIAQIVRRPVVRVSSRVVAPFWVRRGVAYHARARLLRARRRARVVARYTRRARRRMVRSWRRWRNLRRFSRRGSRRWRGRWRGGRRWRGSRRWRGNRRWRGSRRWRGNRRWRGPRRVRRVRRVRRARRGRRVRRARRVRRVRRVRRARVRTYRRRSSKSSRRRK